MWKQTLMAAVVSAIALSSAGCISLGGGKDTSPTVHGAGYGGVRGTGDISFRAPHDGIVNVVDEGKGEVLLSGPVRGGDIVEVRPRRNEILVNGRAVVQRTLGNGAMYNISMQSGGGYGGYYRQDDRRPHYDRRYDSRYDRYDYDRRDYDRRARDW